MVETHVSSGSPPSAPLTDPFVPGVMSTGVLANPVAVAVDNSGNVYAADNNTNNIYKFNSSGNATANPFAPLPSASVQHVRMAVDANGNLIVASDNVGNQNGQVEVDKITSAGASECALQLDKQFDLDLNAKRCQCGRYEWKHHLHWKFPDQRFAGFPSNCRRIYEWRKQWDIHGPEL